MGTRAESAPGPVLKALRPSGRDSSNIRPRRGGGPAGSKVRSPADIMIITSLLDTDLYKFTMMQVVLHHFPGATVEYRFRCRTPDVNLAPYVDEIRAEVHKLCQLRFSEDELDYLRRMRFIKSDFVDFLALFHLNEKYISI